MGGREENLFAVEKVYGQPKTEDILKSEKQSRPLRCAKWGQKIFNLDDLKKSKSLINENEQTKERAVCTVVKHEDSRSELLGLCPISTLH